MPGPPPPPPMGGMPNLGSGGPPPPPPMAGMPPQSSSGNRAALLGDISAGARLKKVDKSLIKDRSQAAIPGGSSSSSSGNLTIFYFPFNC